MTSSEGQLVTDVIKQLKERIKKLEAENKCLREALENKDSYIKRLERKVARVEKRFDKLLETTKQTLKGE